MPAMPAIPAVPSAPVRSPFPPGPSPGSSRIPSPELAAPKLAPQRWRRGARPLPSLCRLLRTSAAPSDPRRPLLHSLRRTPCRRAARERQRTVAGSPQRAEASSRPRRRLTGDERGPGPRGPRARFGSSIPPRARFPPVTACYRTPPGHRQDRLIPDRRIYCWPQVESRGNPQNMGVDPKEWHNPLTSVGFFLRGRFGAGTGAPRRRRASRPSVRDHKGFDKPPRTRRSADRRGHDCGRPVKRMPSPSGSL
jgi:hypothetical protein